MAQKVYGFLCIGQIGIVAPVSFEHSVCKSIDIVVMFDPGNQHTVAQGRIVPMISRHASHYRYVAPLGPPLDLAAEIVIAMTVTSHPRRPSSGFDHNPMQINWLMYDRPARRLSDRHQLGGTQIREDRMGGVEIFEV